MSGRVLAIRHVQFEDLGSFAPWFAQSGLQVEYLDAGVDALAGVDVLSPALVVVLGGPIGAYQDALYPFLRDELALIRARLDAGRPLLGICLGAQLIARALGARVYPGPAVEIGWQGLTLTEAGRASPLAALDGGLTSMLHWHGDTFDLPDGAVRLASTPACANQVFALGAHCLAFQCHPEVDSARLEAWLIGHASELAHHGIDLAALRRDAGMHGERLRQQALQCLAAWWAQQCAQ